MTKEEIAWLAGIFEGEACFDLNQNSKPRIRIEMKDEDVLHAIKEICQCGGSVRRISRSNPKHSDTFVFVIYKTEDVCRILESVWPWMSFRRKAKIDLLLAPYRIPATKLYMIY